MLKNNRSEKLAKKIYKVRVEAAYEISKYKNSFLLRNCPCCNKNNIDKSIFKVVWEYYNYKQCSKCLMVYLENIPTDELLEEYYKKVSVLNKILWTRDRTKEFESKIKLINKIHKSGKIIELGCGDGSFVKFLKDNNYESIGYELDTELVNSSIEKGINVKNADILKSSIEIANIYLCYEIIEHLTQPKKFIEKLYKLKSNHSLIITTPNINGFDNAIVGPEVKNRFLASAIFPPYHINAFSVHTLSFLLLKVGYSIKRITTPGRLDLDIVKKHSNFFSDHDFTPNNNQSSCMQDMLELSLGSGHMEMIVRKE